MSFDNHKNFAYSTVATAPSPASSGTSLVVQSGDGAKFPTAPFNATIWPAGSQPSTANAEIVRVTAKSTDTFTITRAQESSSAQSIAIGYQIAATITAKTMTDIETTLTSGVNTLIEHVTNDLSGSGGALNVPTGSESSSTAWITGSSHSYDGATQICVELYVAAVEADFTGAIEFGLYEDGTFVDVIGDQSTGNSSTGATRGGKTLLGKHYFTPSAGSHTYSIKTWAITGTTNNVWSGSNSVGAGTPSKYGVSYMRVTKVITDSTAYQGPQGPAGADGAGVTSKIYDYTVTGSAKASIDTNVDGASAGLFSTSGTVLEIWFFGRTDEAVLLSSVNITFNNDTGANYDRAFVATSTSGSTPISDGGTATASTSYQPVVAGTSMGAGVAGMVRITIPGYADTTFNKVMETFAGTVDTTAGLTHRQQAANTLGYRSTSAITRVKVAPATAGKNLAVGTRLVVYKRT